jgi:ABC-2 type transport system ATP-binding protein
LYARQGHIQTLGENPKDRTANLLSKIFYLPDQVILPSISSQLYLSLNAPFYPSFDKERFEQYTDALEIVETKKLHTLSHGQQKKFMLAFGLAADCPLNLFDEPTNGLDIPSKSVFRKLVAGAVDAGKCFVISTHQVRDIEHLIDTVIVLDNAKIVFSHPLEEIVTTLSTQQGQTDLNGDTVYSSEDGLGRYSVIQKNSSEKPSTVDLELLFNAILADSERVQAVFSR